MRAAAGTIRVLLVEDNPGDARLIRETLWLANPTEFIVEHVPTLADAQDRLREGEIDVVLLDLTLPDSFGVQTVERINAAAPEVPIVVLTGVNDEEIALRAVKANAEDYLVKGQVDESLLARTIRHAVERHRIQVELEHSEEKFRRVIATSLDGMVVVGRDGLVLFANPAAAHLFAREAEELRGLPFAYELDRDHKSELYLAGGRVVEMQVVDIEWEGRAANLASLRDITEHKRSQEALRDLYSQLQVANLRLERLANVDPLTDLLNRRGLESVLQTEVARARRSGSQTVAVLLDCDDFKRINETLGHAVGDVVLKELAARLKDSLRPTDHIARIGGDEFLMLLPETRLAEGAQVAERLRLSVSDSPLRLSSGPLVVTGSLGLALVPDATSSIEELLAQTQLGLRRSKLHGKNRVSGEDADGGLLEGAAEELVVALQRGDCFRAVKQPIYRLSDEEVVGWEMLSRGPRGPFESPKDFFRIALERNILTIVDVRCLNACFVAAAKLPAPADVHVNLFPSTILDTPQERLLELFPRLPGVKWCVEISEQQFIGEPAVLRNHVRALQDAGIQVAIDDVGFGRSSLETLILLEPDVVKIDQKFVAGVAADTGKERSLRRLVDLVVAMESELVAEGIQQREELELLRDVGVPYGQGYYWGIPN